MELNPDMSVQQQMEVLVEGTQEVIDEELLKKKLQESKKEGRPLRVKLGLDPSAPDIHLGHTVVLRKMRQFQDLGHEVVCLIGDFTGRVGDPSGASETRPQLTESEVKENAKTYEIQVFKVLDPDKTIIEFNSKWLSDMSFSDVVELASNVTVARMIERGDFNERFTGDEAIYLHEFFYPLMQGYDSVALEADVELGATDQKFNLLMARQIQRAYDVEPEVAMLMPLVEGLDGTRKMSKSLGNYIGLTEEPKEMFGKVMSIPDELIGKYALHFTDVPEQKVEAMQQAMQESNLNPRDAKVQLAHRLVSMYCGKKQADEAQKEFVRVFSEGQLPEDMPQVQVSELVDEDGQVWIVSLIREAGFADSNSKARRFIKGGAVRIDDEKVTDIHAEIQVEDDSVLRVGKRRFARLRV